MRRYPPVHTPLSYRALGASFLCGGAGSVGGEAISRAIAALAARYPSRQIVLTDSGTSALRLALSSSVQDDRRVVALPAFACPDLGSAALGEGFSILLYDLDPDTLEPDLSSVRRCLADGATHVVATHLYGRIVDVRSMQALAHEYGAVVIEDAAQHAGGSRSGFRGGLLSERAILSFGRGKGLNAGGGGALLIHSDLPLSTERPRAPRMPKSLRTALIATASEILSSPSLYWIPSNLPFLGLGETHFIAPHSIGAITGASARLLCDVLEREPATLSSRRTAETAYTSSLGDVAGIQLLVTDPAMRSGALRFPIRVERSIATSLREFGVEKGYPRLLNDYDEIRRAIKGALPPLRGAATLANELHTLPTHQLLKSADRARLITELRLRAAKS